MIQLERVYDSQRHSGGGTRFLVERLWPRGVRKEDLHYTAWLKDVAPSTTLRKWFNHDPAKWAEFQKKYFAELNANPETLEPLRSAMRKGDVTLLFSSHDEEHNNAVALKTYLTRRQAKSKPDTTTKKKNRLRILLH